MVTSTWQVVGGGESGGIVVRTAKETSSPQAAGGRLATGALVKELGSDGDRLRYEKLQGAGPVRGWVSKTLSSGKTLLKQSPRDQIWKVVGGADKSGILVRTEQATTSPAVSARLSTGALVLEVELVGDRLCYDRLTGTGPCTGWVSVRVASGDGALLVRTDEDPSDHLDDDLRAFGAICELELPCPDAAAPAVRAGFLELPAPFLIGVATAAYQIEGAANEGGRKPSIWDDFSHKSGLTAFGATGDVACDHYHCYKRDVALMAHLGMKAYRLSISWSRLIPDGVGEVNEEGAAFYSSLIDELLAHGITPWVTLYHWDLPLALQIELGGWLSPEIVPLFADYARIVFGRLGDRVKWWITLNEPWCCSVFGYGSQLHAPGVPSKDASKIYLAGHNMLNAHAAAVEVFRSELGLHRSGGKIGVALNASWVEPAMSEDDTIARLNLQAAERALVWNIGWFADPIWKGDYPQIMRDRCGARLPTFSDAERALLRGSSDFFGVNHYMSDLAEPEMHGSLREWHHLWPHIIGQETSSNDAYIWGDMLVKLSSDKGAATTDMGWPIVPHGLREVLLWVHQRYRPTGGIIVTENGCGCEEASPAGALRDSKRIEYFRGYLAEMHRAIQMGVDVRGYFAWTFLDNFEWQHGYDYRFGLVHVDFETQVRTPKASAHWFSAVVRQNTLEPSESPSEMHAPPELDAACFTVVD
mmetsp:Transcript_19907/g.55989  ORF Transcript_19907/g.55989 Transcript_19907/m.55989 type:complete len:701 (-) Transcript_19907:39-2141(-)